MRSGIDAPEEIVGGGVPDGVFSQRDCWRVAAGIAHLGNCVGGRIDACDARAGDAAARDPDGSVVGDYFTADTFVRDGGDDSVVARIDANDGFDVLDADPDRTCTSSYRGRPGIWFIADGDEVDDLQLAGSIFATEPVGSQLWFATQTKPSKTVIPNAPRRPELRLPTTRLVAGSIRVTRLPGALVSQIESVPTARIAAGSGNVITAVTASVVGSILATELLGPVETQIEPKPAVTS